MAETNYIHANARFAFRSDTLANWKNKNPILFAGEFGIATNGSETEKVKIGNGTTPWNELSWWKGPKGDNYILSDYDKQKIANLIDIPDVDQIPDHTSENAVSNKAMTQYVDDNIFNTEQYARDYTDEKIGDIETALDNIIAMQNNLIGGDA